MSESRDDRYVVTKMFNTIREANLGVLPTVLAYTVITLTGLISVPTETVVRAINGMTKIVQHRQSKGK